jgi:hypothetical protein
MVNCMHSRRLAVAGALAASTAMILLLSLVSAHAEPARDKQTAQLRSGWFCHAYGRDRRHWVTVTGSHKHSKKDAERSVMADCVKGLSMCELSGCWQD